MLLMQCVTVMILHTASWGTSGALGHTPCPQRIFVSAPLSPSRLLPSAIKLFCAYSCL